MSTLRDATLRMAALKTLLEGITVEYEQARTRVLAQLKTAHTDLGLTSARIMLPGGAPVGSVTLTQPKARVVIEDAAKFTAWVADTYPDEIVPQVRASWAKAFLARLLDGLDGLGVAVDPSTGEVVPGLEVVEPGPPATFSLRLPGQAALAAALRDGLARDLLVEITNGGPSAITEGGTDGLGS